MVIRVVQLPQKHAAGEIEFRVDGPNANRLAESISIEAAIVHSASGDRYLHIDSPREPWKAQSGTFLPTSIRHEGTAICLTVGHAVTFHLKPNVPYRLRLRAPSLEWAEEVFIVPPGVRLLSTPPEGWREAPPPTAAANTAKPGPAAPLWPAASSSEAPPAPHALPPLPVQDASWPSGNSAAPESQASATTAQSLEQPKPAKGSRTVLVGSALSIAVIGAIAAWWLLGQEKPSGPATVDACRQELMQSPLPSQARESAISLSKSGRLLDCQFLLLKYAASKGDAISARMLGSFYDPETWSKSSSPLPEPNAVEAARWHRLASESGDLESTYRYAMLLKLERTDEPDAAEKGQALLKRAADQGHPLAKAELSR